MHYFVICTPVVTIGGYENKSELLPLFNNVLARRFLINNPCEGILCGGI